MAEKNSDIAKGKSAEVDVGNTKGKTDKSAGKYNNQIVINPVLKEASGKKIVIAWGRMNPPTIGHEKLVNKVKEVAKKTGAKAEIYMSHSQDAKKNPLSYDDKVELARIAFGSVITKLNAKTIIDVMKSLTGKYGSVTLVVGKDRVAEFETLLHKYNGKEFNFDSIDVVSAGERDPDAEGVEGMSASKMRSAASSGDKARFISGLPSLLKPHADDVWDMVRSGMKIAEETELDEAVLDFAARRHRAMVLRTHEAKIQAARERMKKRIADNKHLMSRARKKAIEIIRKKVAGQKGLEYASLPVGEKMIIDQQVEKRKGAIGRIAMKLLPKVRRAELDRVAQMNKITDSHNVHKVNESFEAFLDEGKAYYTGLSKSTIAKRKAHFEKGKQMDDNNPDAYKPAPGDATAETKPSKYTRRYHMMYNGDGKLKYDRRFRAFRHIVRQEELDISDADLLTLIDEAWDIAVETNADMIEEKAMEGLKNKAEKSGIPYSTLKSVYDRGVAAWRTGHRPGTTPQQWGYARVNSFITGGKTRTTADADLAKKINESFEDLLSEGVNDPSIFKAVFLAGGPGSGKSFIVGKTALPALGFKVINSDDAFERGLAKAGLKMTPENIFSDKGQDIRNNAKALTDKKLQLALDGRLGLVIDGTGKNFDKIEKQADKLKKLGYDVALIFVNTNIETSLNRNRMRDRSLPDKEVRDMWNEVQANVGKFQGYFKDKLFIIDNSEGHDTDKAVLDTYRKITAWSKKLPTNPAAKAWIEAHKKLTEALGNTEPNLAPVIPPAPDRLDDSEEAKKKHIQRTIQGALDRATRAKKMHAIHYEENGAGDMGTDKLVKKYKKDTPCESVNEAFESMLEMEVPKSVKHRLGIGVSFKHMAKDALNNQDLDVDGDVDRDDKKVPDETSADPDLTKKFLKKYADEKKHSLKHIAFEQTSIQEEADAEITVSQMKDFEKFVDRMFEKFKIDFEFTKHFGERMNDDRNSPKIKLKELADLIKKIYAKHGNPLKNKPGAEMVVKDLQSDLNMPIVVKYDSKNDEIDIVAKTIMRKKNFATPNPVIKY